MYTREQTEKAMRHYAGYRENFILYRELSKHPGKMSLHLTHLSRSIEELLVLQETVPELLGHLGVKSEQELERLLIYEKARILGDNNPELTKLIESRLTLLYHRKEREENGKTIREAPIEALATAVLIYLANK